MEIYLPIAGVPIDILYLLGLGIVSGFLAGMFGIGGAFIATPLLIFLGIPPAVAVASISNQTIAAAVSGFLSHWRRDNVDVHLAYFLLFGGILGSFIGIIIFKYLKTSGQIDIVISLLYVFVLGTIACFMLKESLKTIKQNAENEESEIVIKYDFFQNLALPFKINFPKSNIQISALIPIALGFMISILVTMMGIGGGFILVPALIYVVGMPPSLVIGTSLFQIIFISSSVTLLQAVSTQSVDLVLSFFMIIGAVFGAQYGSRVSFKFPPEKLRMFLALIMLLVVAKLAYGLFIKPTDLYDVIMVEYE